MRPDSREPSLPLLAHKRFEAPSVFTAHNLLREARRQKRLPESEVPAVCVFDPDGDLLDHLRSAGRASRDPSWACYHTELDTFTHEGLAYGIIGRVVGAPFAVLVAEELFASGCRLLISVTSAGQVMPIARPPYVVLIERALRDEGTSYHYLPPDAYSHLDPGLRDTVLMGWDHGAVPVQVGSSWTTDAPFRETEEMIAAGRELGVLAVEMEAAALYALAHSKGYPIICFAHVTNQMGQEAGDFEKGEAQGAVTTLKLIDQASRRLRRWGQRNPPDG